ncbi:MAG: iron ABC transporter permease, partial [Pseudomonadota bacterium]
MKRFLGADGLLLLALFALTLIAFAGATVLGSTPLPLDRTLAALLGLANAGDSIVVWQIRLPRAVAAWCVGATLGVCGAALQGLLRNPLAEPGVLGVSASASLGATLVLYYGLSTVSPLAVPLASSAMGVAATLLLSAVAMRVGSVVTLILVGVGLSSFVAALMALLLNLAPHPFSIADMINWTLGTVANRSWNDIALVLPCMGGGLAVLFAWRRPLSALALGEEAASAVGVNLRIARIAVVLGAGIATGGAVALAGAVGFVGIVAPHLVRP